MTTADDTAVPDYPALLRLDGRSALVLGAGQGIGRQTAHALAQAGARVFCVDIDEQRAAEIADEVGGVPLVGDITKRDDVQTIVARASADGDLHTIVDIVGASKFAPFMDTSEADLDWTLDIVLRHVFHVGQVGGAALAGSGGGSLVFVSSVSGLTSAPRHGVYGAAKAALMSLVRTMSVELGPQGVRVNAVAPAGTWTPRMAEVLGERGRSSASAVVPLRRIALPADIAAALLFMASDLSAFVNGQVLVVDGGGHQTFPYPIDHLP